MAKCKAVEAGGFRQFSVAAAAAASTGVGAFGAISSLAAWLFIRVGVQPMILCENRMITVHNPLHSCQAPLSKVQTHVRDGGVGMRIEGVGTVHP